jgi:putative endonuclease
MSTDRISYVYFLMSASRRALYIGVASGIEHRVLQHKNHRFAGFSDDNNTTRLVYFERFTDIRAAIRREKQLKGWRREKKENLIKQMNPTYRDLSAEWYEPKQLESSRAKEEPTSTTSAGSFDSDDRPRPIATDRARSVGRPRSG